MVSCHFPWAPLCHTGATVFEKLPNLSWCQHGSQTELSMQWPKLTTIYSQSPWLGQAIARTPVLFAYLFEMGLPLCCLSWPWIYNSPGSASQVAKITVLAITAQTKGQILNSEVKLGLKSYMEHQLSKGEESHENSWYLSQHFPDNQMISYLGNGPWGHLLFYIVHIFWICVCMISNSV
jgi:hypothetical protein